MIHTKLRLAKMRRRRQEMLQWRKLGQSSPCCLLAEQERTVAQVDRLMALCDDLEAQLGAAEAIQGALLEAVVARVVGGTGRGGNTLLHNPAENRFPSEAAERQKGRGAGKEDRDTLGTVNWEEYP